MFLMLLPQQCRLSFELEVVSLFEHLHTIVFLLLFGGGRKVEVFVFIWPFSSTSWLVSLIRSCWKSRMSRSFFSPSPGVQAFQPSLPSCQLPSASVCPHRSWCRTRCQCIFSKSVGHAEKIFFLTISGFQRPKQINVNYLIWLRVGVCSALSSGIFVNFGNYLGTFHVRPKI